MTKASVAAPTNPAKATPAAPVRIMAAYDPDFLRETLAAIASREVSIDESLAFLKPTRMQEIALRSLARGGMSLDEAIEAYAASRPQK